MLVAQQRWQRWPSWWQRRRRRRLRSLWLRGCEGSGAQGDQEDDRDEQPQDDSKEGAEIHIKANRATIDRNDTSQRLAHLIEAGDLQRHLRRGKLGHGQLAAARREGGLRHEGLSAGQKACKDGELCEAARQEQRGSVQSRAKQAAGCAGWLRRPLAAVRNPQARGTIDARRTLVGGIRAPSRGPECLSGASVAAANSAVAGLGALCISL